MDKKAEWDFNQQMTTLFIVGIVMFGIVMSSVVISKTEIKFDLTMDNNTLEALKSYNISDININFEMDNNTVEAMKIMNGTNRSRPYGDITIYDMPMDDTILHLQLHCINDWSLGRKNAEFCDVFMNQSGLLSLYNWGGMYLGGKNELEIN